MSARQGLTENCRFLIEHTGGSIAKELDNQVLGTESRHSIIITLHYIRERKDALDLLVQDVDM